MDHKPDQDLSKEINDMVQEAMNKAREAANQVIAEAKGMQDGLKTDLNGFQDLFDEQFRQFGDRFRDFGGQFRDAGREWRRGTRDRDRQQAQRDEWQARHDEAQARRDEWQARKDEQQARQDEWQAQRDEQQARQDERETKRDARAASLQTQLKKGCLELAVLSLLHQRDMYGYEIVSLISRDIEIAEGTIYPLLKRIKEVGYCQTYLKESQEGPPRKYYSITPAGEESFLEQKEAWLSFVSRMGKVLIQEEA